MAKNNEQRIVEILVNGAKANASIKEMSAAVAVLNAQLKNLPQGTQDFIDKSKQLNEARTRLKSVTDEVNNTAKSFGNWKEVMKGALAAFSVQGIVSQLFSLGSQALESFKEAELASARLDAVLRSTGGAAGIARGELDKMSDSLSKLTRFDDDAISGAQAMLLTFTKVGKDVFPQATETILNMSEALGQDLQQSAVQLGKALNDPVAGMTALKRVGVTFSETQKTLIENFMKTGDIVSAQKVILSELETEFGGVAVAAGNTAAGGLDKFKNRMGNLMEWIGGHVANTLNDLIGLFDKIAKQGASSAKYLIPFVGQALLLKDLISKSSASVDEIVQKQKIQQKELFQGHVDYYRKKTLEELNTALKVQQGNVRLLHQEREAAIKSGDKQAIDQANRAVVRGMQERDAVEKVLQEKTALTDEQIKEKEAKEKEAHKNYLDRLHKEAEAYKKLKADIAKEDDNSLLLDLSKYRKEESAARTKYANLRERAKGHAQDIKHINELEARELKAIANEALADDSKSRKKESEEKAKYYLEQYNNAKALKEKENKDTEDGYRIAIEATREGTDERKKIELEYLNWKLQKELENVNLTEEQRKQIQAKYDNLKKDADAQSFQAAVGNVETYYGSVKQITDTYLAYENQQDQIKLNAIQQETTAAQNKVQSDLAADIAIEQQKLNKKQITQKQFDERKLLLEKQYQDKSDKIKLAADEKEKAIKREQFERNKKASIIEAIINSALAVAKALPNPVLAVLAGIAGAAQVALIASQPVPFATGGPTFKNGGPVNKPFVAMAGEAGPEWIAPNWMLRSPRTANIIGALEGIRQSKSGGPVPFAEGGATGTASLPKIPGAGSGDDVAVAIMGLKQSTDRLNSILGGGIQAIFDYDYFKEQEARINNIRDNSGIK